MTQGKRNITIAVFMLFIPMVYFLGAIAWKIKQDSGIKAEVELGSRIWYICFSSCLYMLSIVVFMFSHLFVKGRFEWMVKAGSAILISVCALILYEEVCYEDKQWSEWNYWMVVIVSFNYFLFYSILDKFKKSIKDG